MLATLAVAALMPFVATAQTEPTTEKVVSPGYLDLDGTRYMKIPNSDAFAIAAGGVRTISLRFMPSATSTDCTYFSNRVRDYSGGNNNNVSGVRFYTSGTTTSVSYNFPSSGWTAYHCHKTYTTPTANVWHTMTWVYNGSTSVLYYDGVTQNVGSTASTASLAMTSLADILIGANYTMSDNVTFSITELSSYFNGQIDNVRIYDAALTADEVTADAAAETYLDGKNIVAAYDFTDIYGARVPDVSGNNHDGELVGDSWPEYYVPMHTVSFTAADAAQGSFTIYNGETEVATGAELKEGTELRIVAKAEFGYKVSSVKVNGTAVDANDAGEYVFTLDDDSTVEVEFAALAYSHYSGQITATDRYITNITIADALGNSGTVTGAGSTRYRNVFVDRTTQTPISLYQGSEITLTSTGNGEWMHTYFFIDYNQDGEFTPEYESDGFTVTANSELVTYNSYSSNGDAGPFYNSKGTPDANNSVKGSIGYANYSGPTPALPTFIIPKDLPEGKYRCRYKVDWNDRDAYGTSSIATNRGTIIDFVIEVSTPRRQVAVASADAAMGSVAITGTDAMSIRTDDDVEVVATPIDPAKFYNWVDGDGTEVSRDATYTYNGIADVDLTANFGYAVTVNAQGATVTFADEQGTAVDPSVVLKGTTLVATVTPDEDVLFKSFGVDTDENAALTDEGTYTFTVDQPVTISAIYSPKWDHADGNVAATYANERYVTSVKVSDQKGNSVTLDGPGGPGVRPVFSDQLDKVLETIPGQELTLDVTGKGDWIQTYIYIDYDNDGIFTPDFAENGAVTEDSELLSSNGYRFDGTNWIDSEGNACASDRGALSYNSAIPAVVLPADLPEGTYRVRYKADWDCTDAYGNTADNNSILSNSGTIIDFTIKIKSAQRTVNVKSSNDKYGIAFLSTEETKTVTTDGDVLAVARPTDPAIFMGWVDDEGNDVSEKAEYPYSGIYDLNLTANFGFEVVFSAGEGGSLTVGTADADITSGDIVLGDTPLSVAVEPDANYRVALFTVNGYVEDLAADGTYSFKLDNRYDIRAEFEDLSGVTNISVDAINGNAEYYDLTGARINAENLTPGLYIRRIAGRAHKVLIK